MLRRLATGYVALAAFIAVFSVLSRIRPWFLVSSTQDAKWEATIALVIVLPLMIEYARTVFTRLKLGGFEADFREVQRFQTLSVDVTSIALELSAATSLEKLEHVELAPGADISFSGWTVPGQTVIDKVREIMAANMEVVLVDLGTGDRWLLERIYFLTLLLAYRTTVKQLVFTESRDGIQAFFVGTCPPREFLDRIGLEVPTLLAAAKKTNAQEAELSIQLLQVFFSALEDALRSDPSVDTGRRWVTSSYLAFVLGASLRRAAIEWQGRLDRRDCITILSNAQDIMAVVEKHRYLFSLDRGKIAVAIARNAINEDIT